MSKETIQRFVIGFVVVLFVASALGYAFAPSTMLSIVGMASNADTDFLVRTLAAALLALTPGAWAARRRSISPDQRGVLVGLAAYMFISSLLDLRAFLDDVVGIASIPSVVLRVIIGGVILWLIPQRSFTKSGDRVRQDSRGLATRSAVGFRADRAQRWALQGNTSLSATISAC